MTSQSLALTHPPPRRSPVTPGSGSQHSPLHALLGTRDGTWGRAAPPGTGPQWSVAGRGWSGPWAPGLYPFWWCLEQGQGRPGQTQSAQLRRAPGDLGHHIAWCPTQLCAAPATAPPQPYHFLPPPPTPSLPQSSCPCSGPAPPCPHPAPHSIPSPKPLLCPSGATQPQPPPLHWLVLGGGFPPPPKPAPAPPVEACGPTQLPHGGGGLRRAP